MQFSDLPSPRTLVSSARTEDLVDALATALSSETRLQYFTIARGGPQSCRVFFEEPGPDRLELDAWAKSPAGIAAELITLSETEARYPSPDPGNCYKGWEIGVVQLGPEKAVVSNAAWVKPV